MAREKRTITRRARPPMPVGVIVAVVALAAMIVLSAIGIATGDRERQPIPPEPQLAVAVLFLVFLIRGHPLARQWALFAFTMGFLAGLVLLRDDPTVVVGAVTIGIAIAVVFGLTLPSSKRFFDLECPKCGSGRVRAKSLLYNRILCRQCKFDWRLRQHEIDVAAFE